LIKDVYVVQVQLAPSRVVRVPASLIGCQSTRWTLSSHAFRFCLLRERSPDSGAPSGTF